MRKILFFILLFPYVASAQSIQIDSLSIGSVSYITSQHVYVKFNNTSQIQILDTLWMKLANNDYTPTIQVSNKSSVSIVGKIIGDINLKVGDLVLHRAQHRVDKTIEPSKKDVEIIQPIKKTTKTMGVEQDSTSKLTPKLYGRISASSFTGMSNSVADDSYRLRYKASIDMENIKGTPLSFEGYTVFTHRPGHWNQDYQKWSDALKIYNLALGANLTKVQGWIGRKINSNISSIGAIDGLQLQAHLKGFDMGVVGGSRPDYSNYGFNFSLPQYGAFVAHKLVTDQGEMKNSMAFFEQRNSGAIDRRFAYFQHTNSLIKKVYLFMSGEIDLYQKSNGQISHSPTITSIYLSVRYRPSRQLSIYGMYDARNNVIYYETYKDYVERLLEEATRQGLQLRINYRPFKRMNVGLAGGYRTREGDLRPNINLRSYINITQVPGIMANLSVSGNILQTNYLDGMVVSSRLSKSLVNHKLLTTMGYRFVNYTFTATGSKLIQHSIETNLSYQFNRLTSLSVNYELNFESKYLYHRIYFNFVQRIKK